MLGYGQIYFLQGACSRCQLHSLIVEVTRKKIPDMPNNLFSECLSGNSDISFQADIIMSIKAKSGDLTGNALILTIPYSSKSMQ